MQTIKHITLGFVIGVLLMIGANSMGAVVAVTILPTLEKINLSEGEN